MRTKALIMAGGTGGHVFPGLALATELRARGHEVEWLGTQAGIESRLVPAADITLNTIPVKGVRGKSAVQKLLAPLNIISSVYRAIKILKRVQPNVVVGLGGFAAGPGGMAAKILGIPLVIHEQNAIAGTTNKVLAKMASKVLTAFPNVFTNGIFIGNPVRKEIEALGTLAARRQARAANDKIHILVLGGSRGAQAINEMLPEAFANAEHLSSVDIWHQTGEQKLESTQALYQAKNITARVDAFIDDVAAAYGWADLVVCRAGALTVSELAAAGLGAIFIPFPFAIDDHQTANAKCLAKIGAADIFQQSQINATMLAERLDFYMTNKEKIFQMAKASHSFAKPEAAKVFADHCEEFMHV